MTNRHHEQNTAVLYSIREARLRRRTFFEALSDWVDLLFA